MWDASRAGLWPKGWPMPMTGRRDTALGLSARIGCATCNRDATLKVAYRPTSLWAVWTARPPGPQSRKRRHKRRATASPGLLMPATAGTGGRFLSATRPLRSNCGTPRRCAPKASPAHSLPTMPGHTPDRQPRLCHKEPDGLRNGPECTGPLGCVEEPAVLSGPPAAAMGPSGCVEEPVCFG